MTRTKSVTRTMPGIRSSRAALRASVMKLAMLVSATVVFAFAQQQVQIQPGTPNAGGPTFKFLSGNLIGGNVVKGAPYSADAVTDMTQTLADGNRIVQHFTATQYRDSEGRERREQELSNLGPLTAGSDPVKTIFISDPVVGANYSLNPADHTAVKLPVPSLPDLPAPPPGDGSGAKVVFRQMTMNGANVSISGSAVSETSESGASVAGTPGLAGGPIMIATGSMGVASPGLVSGAPGPGPNVMYFSKGMGAPTANVTLTPPNVEQLGSKTIAGVSATGTRTTITIPAGQIGNDKAIEIVDERWYSPELQVTMQSTHSDPRMGTTNYSLQNVSRGEPASTLFQVPADYAVKDAPDFFTKKVTQ